MINNPPHILNKEGKLVPSALIPFCSFNSILEGKFLANISFPVCDLFDPVVHDGKLCYQLDMAKKIYKESKKGIGLTLIIDANVEKSVATHVEPSERNNLKTLDLRKVSVETKKLVKVNIGTLEQHYDFGPGNYILSAVKQMTATKGFLSMSKEKRKCEKEKLDSCQKRLFQERIKTCGCVPQNLIPALQDQSQVIIFN